MSEIILSINPQSLEAVKKYNLGIDDFLILKMLVHSTSDLLGIYAREKTAAQKIIMMQPLVRKQLIDVEEDYHMLEENFSFKSYTLTLYGRQVYAELNKILTSSSYVPPQRPDFVGAISSVPTVGQLMSGYNSKEEEMEKFNTFVREYINLFPVGKNGGNKTLRSNFEDVKDKMVKFFNKYKRFKEEDVISATRMFLKKFRGDYTYCPTAEYFVMKDRSSALATECDANLVRKEDGVELEDNSSTFEQLM